MDKCSNDNKIVTMTTTDKAHGLDIQYIVHDCAVGLIKQFRQRHKNKVNNPVFYHLLESDWFHSRKILTTRKIIITAKYNPVSYISYILLSLSYFVAKFAWKQRGVAVFND